MSVSLQLPFPQSFFEWVWMTLGITFGRGFGKNCDQRIQQTAWFKKRRPVVRWLIERLLDVTHHWWIGALIMLYATGQLELYWFGYGLLLDDLPDIPSRLREMLGHYWETVKNGKSEQIPLSPA